MDIFLTEHAPILGPLSLFNWNFVKEDMDIFITGHAPILGPLSLFSWNFVEEMYIFFNRTRPYPGASESV